MFSNLTSYFWGGGSGAPATDATQEVAGSPLIAAVGTEEVSAAQPKRVESVGAGLVIVSGGGEGAAKDVEEEDWLMVDTSAGSEEDKMEEAEGEEELHPLRPGAPATAPHPGMEESWIIAPTPTTLPCLVESAMEVSPLETLLIEHPSMSVYHKLESPVRSLKLSSPTSSVISQPKPTSPPPQIPTKSSKPEAPTIEALPQPAPPVQPNQGSQTKKLVVKKSSNQKSKQPAKPPQIPFILQQKAQKHKPVPEPTPAPVVAKPKPVAVPASQPRNTKPAAKPEVVVPNKTPKAKSKKVTIAAAPVEKTKPVAVSAKKPLGEIQNAAPAPVVVKVSKKATTPPMNRIVESNIKEMFPTHVYPKDMRPFVEDFQNNVNTRQHRELIAAQRRSQLAMTRAKRTARRNPFAAVETADEMKTEAAVMMEQKENNVVEMRRQEQFEILLRSSQKQQQKRLDQSLRKNHLSRSNKAIHELSSRNKRQRRNDHTNKPSGASNNRKVNTQ